MCCHHTNAQHLLPLLVLLYCSHAERKVGTVAATSMLWQSQKLHGVGLMTACAA